MNQGKRGGRQKGPKNERQKLKVLRKEKGEEMNKKKIKDDWLKYLKKIIGRERKKVGRKGIITSIGLN